MSRHRVEHGAWCATVGARLPVTANGKRIGTALVCDDGSLLVDIDDSELAQVIETDSSD